MSISMFLLLNTHAIFESLAIERGSNILISEFLTTVHCVLTTKFQANTSYSNKNSNIFDDNSNIGRKSSTRIQT